MNSKELFGVAVLAAAAYGFYRYTQKAVEEAGMVSFSLFQKNSVTVDTLTGKQVADWIREDSHDQSANCILAFPTEAMLKRFHISDCPAELDPKTNLLQFTVDKEYNVVAARLISFGEMSAKLREMFAGEDYFVVKGIEDVEENV